MKEPQELSRAAAGPSPPPTSIEGDGGGSGSAFYQSSSAAAFACDFCYLQFFNSYLQFFLSFFFFFFTYPTAARSYSTAAVSGSAGRVFVKTQCRTHKSFFQVKLVTSYRFRRCMRRTRRRQAYRCAALEGLHFCTFTCIFVCAVFQ